MDIWTERLEPAHLPIVGRWLGRTEGALTPNDLPADADGLTPWLERCAAESGRLDCLCRVYETPVGVAALRRPDGSGGTAELSLLLGEVNYNPLRTATYVTLRMLDRAFLEPGVHEVRVRAFTRHAFFLPVLERMGFARTEERDGLCCCAVEKARYLDRKYLF